MPHVLPALPYPVDALEPHIDATTMKIHHEKHHGKYVEKLNAALKNHPGWQEKPVGELLRNLKSLPEEIRTAVRNNGGGHANHSLFWESMTPRAGKPGTNVVDALSSAFGSFNNFKEKCNRRLSSCSAAGGRGSSSTTAASRSRARQTRTARS